MPLPDAFQCSQKLCTLLKKKRRKKKFGSVTLLYLGSTFPISVILDNYIRFSTIETLANTRNEQKGSCTTAKDI